MRINYSFIFFLIVSFIYGCQTTSYLDDSQTSQYFIKSDNIKSKLNIILDDPAIKHRIIAIDGNKINPNSKYCSSKFLYLSKGNHKIRIECSYNYDNSIGNKKDSGSSIIYSEFTFNFLNSSHDLMISILDNHLETLIQ